jgi:hypothetical protein
MKACLRAAITLTTALALFAQAVRSDEQNFAFNDENVEEGE